MFATTRSRELAQGTTRVVPYHELALNFNVEASALNVLHIFSNLYIKAIITQIGVGRTILHHNHQFLGHQFSMGSIF